MKKGYSNTRNFDHPFFNIPKEERMVNGSKGALIAGYRPYSKEENDFIIQNYQKIPLTEMARIFGRSAKSVFTRSKKLIRDGLIQNDGTWQKSHYTAEEDAFIIESQNKMSFAQVGQVLGRSRDSVKIRAGKLGVSYQKVAETSPVVKLSNEDIEFIRELSDSGLNYCQIAEKFDVDNSHIRKICVFESRLYLDKQDLLSTRQRQISAIDNQD